MADYVTKIRTSTGDKQIDYNALANLPNLDPVASATKLATARNILTNLESTLAASFDGTSDITPGITGILQEENGGTGVTSISSLVTLLVNNGLTRIQTGSYIGTGTYGEDNPCSLTLDFPPIFVFVSGDNAGFNKYYGGFLWINGMTSPIRLGEDGVTVQMVLSNRINIQITDNVLSWWTSSDSATYQANESSKNYYYIILG